MIVLIVEGALVAVILIVGLFPIVIPALNMMGYDLERNLVSEEKSREADEYLKPTFVTGAMVLSGDQVLYEYGNIRKVSNLHSVRKSVISILFGVAEGKGLVDIHKTLGEIGIDESRNPLTDVEKTATIRDLLMARSGIYLASGGETEWMKENRPRRGQFRPGENFSYNNWDFNVLGTILEIETGLSIGEALEQWIGTEIGLQDFKARHVTYCREASSDYKTWRIYMSTRDMARLGVLMLQNGQWDGKQIVPAQWVTDSFVSHTGENEELDYGYLWWIDQSRDIAMGVGYHGQYLVIDKRNDLVAAIRINSGTRLLVNLVVSIQQRDIEDEEVYGFIDLFIGE